MLQTPSIQFSSCPEGRPFQLVSLFLSDVSVLSVSYGRIKHVDHNRKFWKPWLSYTNEFDYCSLFQLNSGDKNVPTGFFNNKGAVHITMGKIHINRGYSERLFGDLLLMSLDVTRPFPPPPPFPPSPVAMLYGHTNKAVVAEKVRVMYVYTYLF